MAIFYSETAKMSDIICDEPSLLQMMSRFGIRSKKCVKPTTWTLLHFWLWLIL